MTTTPSPWSVGRRKFQDARARRAAGSTEVSVCRSATLTEYGSADSTLRWAVVGSASIDRAWSGWVATTTPSYDVTQPLPSVTCTPSGVSAIEVTLQPVRTSGSTAASRSTYSREPPETVRHSGEPKMPSIPWCSRNVNR